MTIIAFLWPYFFDYIIFDFEIQFIITFYGSYDALDKDRFAALDIRADFFLLALSLFCVVTSTQEATSLSDDHWFILMPISERIIIDDIREIPGGWVICFTVSIKDTQRLIISISLSCMYSSDYQGVLWRTLT